MLVAFHSVLLVIGADILVLSVLIICYDAFLFYCTLCDRLVGSEAPWATKQCHVEKGIVVLASKYVTS